MHEAEALAVLQRHNAVITNTHVVYTSGRHGSAYVNKDAIYPDTSAVSTLCQALARHFAELRPEVVAAPAVGGVILSQWTAFHLNAIRGPCLSVYAERTDAGSFEFRRGYHRLVKDRRVLVVEDIVTTGGSLKAVVTAVEACAGRVIGAGVLCNRGNVTRDQVGSPPELYSLVQIELDSWEETDCPLCKRGVPINIEVGKGKEFLARRQSDP